MCDYSVYLYRTYISLGVVFVVGDLGLAEGHSLPHPVAPAVWGVGMNTHYGGWLGVSTADCYPLAVEELEPVVFGKDHFHLHGVLLLGLQARDSYSEPWEHSPAV